MSERRPERVPLLPEQETPRHRRGSRRKPYAIEVKWGRPVAWNPYPDFCTERRFATEQAARDAWRALLRDPHARTHYCESYRLVGPAGVMETAPPHTEEESHD